jgi:uncharacterized protein YegL
MTFSITICVSFTIFIAIAHATCAGVTEESCLSSSTGSSGCCVWCGRDDGTGKCVSAPAQVSSQPRSCADALETFCSDDPKFSSSACFCCTECAPFDVNAIGDRPGQLIPLIVATVFAFSGHLFSHRITPLLVLGALFGFAMPSAHAFSLFGRDMMTFFVELDSSSPSLVQPMSVRMYEPRHAWHHLVERASPVVSEVRSMTATAVVTDNFARTTVSASVFNTAPEARLQGFSLNVPENAFVSGLEIVIGSQRFVGKVVTKAVAQQMFAKAVAAGKTAGLLQSRNTKEFAIAINTAASTAAVFTIVFEEYLMRTRGVFKYSFNVNPGQVVPSLRVKIDLFNENGLKDLKWSHALRGDGVSSIDVKSKFNTVLTFEPDEALQRRAGEYGLAEDVDVTYMIDAMPSSGSIVVAREGELGSRNGGLQAAPVGNNATRYFLHQFATPDWVKPSTLSVVFVIDTSGSMAGQKMTQARDALVSMLSQLRATDRFAIVRFSTTVEQFDFDMKSGAEANDALPWVRNLDATGATNIGDAMTLAHRILSGRSSLGSAPDTPLVLLLTDGEPTIGVTDPTQLRNNVAIGAASGNYRVYALGFGFDLNFDLLRNFGLDTDGGVKRIYDDSDAAQQLTGFFDEIASPLLSDVVVKFAPTHAVEQLTRSTFPTLFKGTELVVAGVIKDPTVTSIKATVTARTCGCQVSWTRVFDLNSTEEALVNAEKAWAFLTVTGLLSNAARDERIADGMQPRTTAKDTATALALKYGFVTPYTSFVVVADEKNQEMLTGAPPTTTLGAAPPTNLPIFGTDLQTSNSPPVVFGAPNGGVDRDQSKLALGTAASARLSATFVVVVVLLLNAIW